MEELRRHRRLQIPLQVEVRHPAIGTLEVPASDISDGGIFIKVDECFQLESGESVIVRTLGLGLNADEIGPPLVMKVVRKTKDGMGLCLEETASENLKSLATDPTAKLSVMQSIFLVNRAQEVLFTMQGDHWRLPSRELGSAESWQQGIQALLKTLLETASLDANNNVRVQANCYPHTVASSACVDLVIPAYTTDSAEDLQPLKSDGIESEPTYSWFNSLEIGGLNTVLDPELVDKLLSQV